MNNTAQKTTSSSALFIFIFLLLLISVLVLLVFLVQYLRQSCGPEGKMNYWNYLSNLDIQKSPCNPPKPEQEFEERERKNEKEVFHISDQIYTYPEAQQKCNAYGAELANEQQIIDAYNKGAEWVSYGWSKGQKAFYPIQPCSFVKLRRKGVKIGPPGVNGGHFKKNIRFGANCYGVKPEGSVIQQKPPVCAEFGNHEICHRNPKACRVLDTDRIDGFVWKKKWSEFD